MAVTLKGQTAVYEGVSTDTKPTDADNNAIFKELDTGIRYYYDGTDWNEIPSSGGGGGGTGTDNYNELNNKPSINGTTLSGNKSLDNLGIQAKLTFDSAPTEDSENPVTSGGVYTALGTTVSTVTNAVNALDVTGDASVSASKTISAWSETDGKVSISTQDIAITGTQATLTGYAKSGTAGQAVAATDNVNQAIGKLEATVDDNKNNISFNTNNGVKNIYEITNVPTVSEVTITKIDTNTVSLNGTFSSTTYAFFTLSTNNVILPAGDWVVFTKTTGTIPARTLTISSNVVSVTLGSYAAFSTSEAKQIGVYVQFFTNDSVNGSISIMICPKSLYEADPTYQPYAMSNAELTAKEQANESNISSIMMSGTARTADLNTIAVNDFGVYTNRSSNLPSADYCFVRTSVNPEAPTTLRLQEAFVMSTGISYIRTMGGGEWHNWLQITNA